MEEASYYFHTKIIITREASNTIVIQNNKGLDGVRLNITIDVKKITITRTKNSFLIHTQTDQTENNIELINKILNLKNGDDIAYFYIPCDSRFMINIFKKRMVSIEGADAFYFPSKALISKSGGKKKKL